jgi:hypothetical protein
MPRLAKWRRKSARRSDLLNSGKHNSRFRRAMRTWLMGRSESKRPSAAPKATCIANGNKYPSRSIPSASQVGQNFGARSAERINVNPAE